MSSITDVTYYQCECIRLVCDIEIKYRRGSDASRNEAITSAMELHMDAAGVSSNGCYRVHMVKRPKIEERHRDYFCEERSVAAIAETEAARPPVEIDPVDEFWGGIWWVKACDAFGLRSATPGECAAEIKRLRSVIEAAEAEARRGNGRYEQKQ